MVELDLVALLAFAAAAFVGAIVAGVAGFAFGLVAAALWLHILAPAQTAALIVAFGLVIQGMSTWRLRRAIRPGRVLPFMLGAAAGVPLGVAVLGWVSPAAMRVGVGVLLVVYGLHGLARPRLPAVTAGGGALDAVIGCANGVLGGATGLSGVVTTVWCGLRGWPRDEQRAVFQPVTVATFVMIVLWLGGAGMIRTDTAILFALGLPAVLAGTWLGLRLYGKVDEDGFRRIVLALLLVSGLALIV